MLDANLPSPPENLNKNLLNLKKGYISILWETQNDDVGLPILRCNIYLNNIYIVQNLQSLKHLQL